MNHTATSEVHAAIDDLLRSIELDGEALDARSTLAEQIVEISQQGAPEAHDTTVSGSPVSSGTLTCFTYCQQNACYARVEIPAPVALVG